MGRRLRRLFKPTPDRPLRRHRGPYGLTKEELNCATNADWHAYYVRRYNKTEAPDAALLAMLYHFRALRDGEMT